MPPNFAREIGLPPVDQVARVVHDLDRTLETFTAIFGEFQTMEHEGALVGLYELNGLLR